MGGGTTTLRTLIREYLFVSLFRACAESLASENASRLTAMQRADKNVDECDTGKACGISRTCLAAGWTSICPSTAGKRCGQSVLIAGHGNSLRALVKYLDDVSDADIAELNIPTGISLVYELDDKLHPLRHYYLGDAVRVQQAMQAVAGQASVKH